MQTSRLVAVGLAIFAMLFGAGNVVFPLGLGRDAGSQVFFAIAGFIVTGVLVPILGLVSAALFGGDYKKFFAMTGRLPGAIIALLCMLLLGPFGATPRCITLVHGAIKWHVPGLDLFVFSLAAAVLIFLATMRKSSIVDLMGRLFGPIKLLLLLTIIVVGLFSSVTPPASLMTDAGAFMRGFSDGYLTLDLIATIFFSALIAASIKAHHTGSKPLTSRQLAGYGLKAGLIGGSLLGLVYVGFSFATAKQAAGLSMTEDAQLLSAITTILLGAKATILANITMAIACMTTAIALTAVFADYLAHEVFFGKIKYIHALLMTVSLNFAMTNLGFAGLAQIIAPLVLVCYPALIVLSLANIAHVLWKFQYVKEVVLTTVLINVFMTLYSHAATIKNALAAFI